MRSEHLGRVQCWWKRAVMKITRTIFQNIDQSFCSLDLKQKTCINPRLIPTEQPHWLILLPVIAISQRPRQPWGSFPVALLSLVVAILFSGEFPFLVRATSLKPFYLEIWSRPRTVLSFFCCDECLNLRTLLMKVKTFARKRCRKREKPLWSVPSRSTIEMWLVLDMQLIIQSIAARWVQVSKDPFDEPCFSFFSPSSDKFIFNSVAELS